MPDMGDCKTCRFCAGIGMEKRTSDRVLPGQWWWPLNRFEMVTTKHRVIQCARFPRHYTFVLREENTWHGCGEHKPIPRKRPKKEKSGA